MSHSRGIPHGLWRSPCFVPQFPYSGGPPSMGTPKHGLCHHLGPLQPLHRTSQKHPQAHLPQGPCVQPVSPNPAQARPTVLGSHPHRPHLGPLCPPVRSSVPGERGWGGPGLIARAGTRGATGRGIPGALGRIKSSFPTAPLCLTRSSPAGELLEQNIFQVRGYVTNISG